MKDMLIWNTKDHHPNILQILSKFLAHRRSKALLLVRRNETVHYEVANPVYRKKRLLGTHQWQSALLVVGLPVTHDWFEMGCHLSSSLISIRLMA